MLANILRTIKGRLILSLSLLGTMLILMSVGGWLAQSMSGRRRAS